MCIDSYTTKDNTNIKLYDCHHLGYNQFFAFTKNGKIHTTSSNQCISAGEDNISIVIKECTENDKTQLWKYNDEVSR